MMRMEKRAARMVMMMKRRDRVGRGRAPTSAASKGDQSGSTAVDVLTSGGRFPLVKVTSGHQPYSASSHPSSQSVVLNPEKHN